MPLAAVKKRGIDIEMRTARATSMSGVDSSEKTLTVLLEISVPVMAPIEVLHIKAKTI